MTRCLTLMMLLLFGTMNKAAAEDLPAVKYMAYDTSTGEMVEKTLAAGSYIPVTQTAANVMVALAESQEAEEVELNPGWYVVSGTVNFSKGLALAPSTASAPIGARRKGVTSTSNEVNIILTDGCKLTVNGSLIFNEGKAITLNIYAQSGNTGTAKFIPAPAPNDDMKLLFISENGSMNVHGGNIEAKIRIMCDGALNFYSGTLNAQFDGGTDDTAPSFGDKASINLSWARGTESYKSDSYPTNVTLLKPFYVDGTTPVGATATNITGKTIKPGIVKTLAAAATTWYNDSDYDWALPTGLTAYAVTAFDETKAASAAVTTTALSYIPAKTGVLLEGTASTSYFLTPYTGTTSTVTSLLTTGTPIAYKDYIYDGTDFVLYSGTGALADGKCYLPGTAAKTVTVTTVDAVKIVTPTGGTITAAQNSTTVTLTATPSVGYYITAADIVVTKTAPNGKALARGLAEKLAVTAGTVDATGKGTYKFTLPDGYGAVVEATFTAQTDISKATVTLDWTEKDYKPGTVQKAAVTKVTLNDTDLSATDDYGVTYKETKWIDHGTYTINVTGKGKYKGTATTTFRINALKVAAVGTGANQIAVVFKGTNSSSITFDGAAHGVDVMVGGKAAAALDITTTITDSRGTTVSDCTNAGTYGVNVEGGASGNITTDGSLSAGLTIVPKDLSGTVNINGDEVSAMIINLELPEGGYIYDGSEKKPKVAVIDIATGATIDPKEYTVDYANNINAGTAIVTVTDVADGNYTVSGRAMFAITPKPISEFTLTGIPEGGFVYDGTAKTVGVAYNNGTEDITISDSEYNMTYKLGIADATELKDAGTYTVTVTNKTDGNYTINGSKPLTIAPKPVSTTAEGGATATLEIELTDIPTGGYVYDGTAKTPTVKVYDLTVSPKTEVPSTEFTVGYANNINAGTATVTLTDVEGGNYTVSGSTTFEIGRASLTAIADDQSITFNDAVPTYTISYSGFVNGETAAVLGEKIPTATCTYQAGDDAGEYEITVSGGEALNYAFSYQNGKLTVAPKKISTDGTGDNKLTIGLEGNPSSIAIFDGFEKDLRVKVGERMLVRGVDFNATITCNSRLVDKMIDAGLYEVRVVSVVNANYDFDANSQFIIQQRKVTNSEASATMEIELTGIPEGGYVYDGTEKTPGVKVYDVSVTPKTEVPSTEFTVGYANNINAGTATVTVSDNADGNYDVSGSTTFTIIPKTVTDFALTGIPEGGFVYDGTAKTVGVAYNDGTNNVTIDKTEYTMSYKLGTAAATELKAAGTYTVTLTDKEGGNYTISGSKELTIAPKPVNTTGEGGAATLTITLSPRGATYTGGDLTPTVTVKDGETSIDKSEYTVAFTLDGTAVEKCINVGNYTVTVSDNAGGNYDVSGSTTFTIIPKTVTDFALTGIPEGGFVYDGTAKTVGVAYNDGTNNVTIDKTEYTMSYKLGTAAATELKAAGTYTVTLTDKEGGNYTISGSKELTIAPKPVNTTGEGGAATLTITLSPTGATYTGGDLTPTVTVKDGETSIDKSEYTVAFTLNGTAVEKCINIGNYTVTITDKEGGNYTVSGTAMFTISPPSFTDESGVIFHYEELTDGTIKIISVKVPKGVTDVNIPATIGSKKVSAIGKDAFKGNTGVVNITIPTTAKPLTIDKSAFTTGEGGDKEPDVIVPSGMADKYAGQLLEEIGPNLVTLLNFVADHKYKTVSSAYSILIPVDAGIDVYKVVGNYIGNDSKLTSVALKAYQNLQKVTVKGVQYYRLDPTAFTSIATTRAGDFGKAVRCVLAKGPSFASVAYNPAIAVYGAANPTIKLRFDKHIDAAFRSRKAVNEEDPNADNLLYPVLEPTHFAPGQIWILKDDQFYGILDDDAETPAGVAVLRLPAGTSGARIITIEEDNSEATGIKAMDNGQWTMDKAEGWYTLDGRKLDVAPKTKGVYIHNGVKVVVK